MKIVVVGGTGLIGGRLVELLREAGHEVVAASPSTGINSVMGEGLADAFAGADIVYDIPNSPSWADADVLEFFQKSTGNIVAAAAKAGVGHHIVLSIVGVDRMPDIGYMRAKLAQEQVAKSGGVPYTIVRSTQFHEFIPALVAGGTEDGVATLSPVLMQPIAAADVSAALAKVADREPKNDTIELAGPEPLRLAELGGRLLRSRGDDTAVVADEAAGYYGGHVDDTSLTPGHDPAITEQLRGTLTFDEWLAAQFWE
jgi:uncharacterized protein YbjT (DUF2867 family)